MLSKEQLITDVMYLAMMINYKTDYCVFIRFSGHVDKVEITICESKTNFNEDVARCEISLRSENVINRLNDVKKQLKEILDYEEVDTSQMDYEVEEIRHYYF